MRKFGVDSTNEVKCISIFVFGQLQSLFQDCGTVLKIVLDSTYTYEEIAGRNR